MTSRRPAQLAYLNTTYTAATTSRKSVWYVRTLRDTWPWSVVLGGIHLALHSTASSASPCQSHSSGQTYLVLANRTITTHVQFDGNRRQMLWPKLIKQLIQSNNL